MAPAVRFEDEAAEELAAAVDWYDHRRPGLGSAFLAALDATSSAIARRPARFPLVPGVPPDLGVRRALLQRFPFAVVFIELASEIRVLAIAHGRRKPGYWRDRVPRTST